MSKMPLMFFSKIFVESQNSKSNDAEVAQKEIVPAMLEQINHFSNKFYDLQALIKELKNYISIRPGSRPINPRSGPITPWLGSIMPRLGLIKLRSV